MSVISKDLMRVLGSTAVALVLSNNLASATSVVVNGAAYQYAGGGTMTPDGLGATYQVATINNGRAWGILVSGAAGAGSTLNVSNINVITSGPKAHGIQVGAKGSDADGTDHSIIHLLGGVAVTTDDADSFALHAIDGGTIDGTVQVTTTGTNGFGAFAESWSSIVLTNSTINTAGQNAFGVIANNDMGTVAGRISGDNLSITTTGSNASGAYADNGGQVLLTNSNIVTGGTAAYGVEALSGAVVTLNGGTITTSGNSARAIQADDATVVANDVTIVTNNAARFSEGVQSQNNASVTLNGGSITTYGLRNYGLIASNGGSITSSADISTYGNNAHAVQAGAFGTNHPNYAYDGTTSGTVYLTGGTIRTYGDSFAVGLHALDEGVIDARNITVETVGASSFGAFAESASTIKLSAATIRTTGSQAYGLLANNDEGTAGGLIAATNTDIVTSGAGAAGAMAQAGGSISITGGSVTALGETASALAISGSGTIEVEGAVLKSAQGPTIGVVLTSADDVAHIRLGSGTVATENNGILLQVDRSNGAGSGGVVNIELDAGSVSKGNIIDLQAKTGAGNTNLVLQQGAQWTGFLQGITHIQGMRGSSLVFEQQSVIAGNLTGVQSSFDFGDEGDSIGGNVTLTEGSVTRGGTVAIPVQVGGNVSVDQTSILGGNWHIAGNLVSAGTITPGNSIGIVAVDGDLTLASSSAYTAEINAQGEADLIKVGGTANLAGTVTVSTLGGYQLDRPYTILTAGNLAGTTFSSVSWSGSTTFIAPNLSYDANNVLLTIGRNDVALSSVAQTDNQRAVAEAVDGLDLSNSVANSVVFLDAAGARAAFDQLSGDAYASTKTSLIETSHLVADAINNRLRSAFAGVESKDVPVLSYAKTQEPSRASAAIDAASDNASSAQYGFWATGFGSWVKQDGNANTGGVSTSSGGFISGLDVGLAGGWRFGFAGGYSQSDIDFKGRNAAATSDSWHLGIYGGNQWGALGLRAGLIQTWHSIDASRSVSFADLSNTLEADYDARTLQAFGEIGYRLDTAAASFEPFANLAHVRLRTDGFTETGGAAALNVESDKTNTTFTTLGLRAEAPLSLGSAAVNLKGSLGWRHAYGDIIPVSTQALAGGDAFTVAGAPIAKDTALLEAGLDFDVTPASTLGVSHVGQYGSGAKQNGFKASFNIKF
ncbi:autotransporter domain-containing protein [Ochrobactrum sp. GPK 3]